MFFFYCCSTEVSATQKKCVQDCPTTSEYDPLCGTDNVTYINAGKFTCAQNCGVGKDAHKNYNTYLLNYDNNIH